MLRIHKLRLSRGLKTVQKALLTVQDIIRIFQISRRTVYHWVKKGILIPIRLGGVLRFHPEDIEALLEKEPLHAPAGKKRVLAVDDDILVRESLKMLLEKEGLAVRLAAGGEEAVRFSSQEPFDLIITDIRMPGMNGIQTLQAIRRERFHLGKTPLPEIVLTAYDDGNVRDEAARLGVKEFIVKPFDLSDFLSTVRRMMN